MKSDVKKRSYEGTRYDKSVLSKDYSELLQSILDQLTADALNEVPLPPNTAAKDVAWDGRYFWNFVSNLQKDDKKDFENLLSENRASFGTLNRMPYQGATVDNAEIAICTSAQLLEVPLKEYIERYIVRCKKRKYDIKGFKGHDEIIKNILKKYGIDNIDGNKADFEKEKDPEDTTGNNPSQNTFESVSSSQSFKIQLTFPEAKEDNANYYANSLLQVLGRDKQKARLNQFLTCNSNVAWFQLAGDAGQGKSRLAFDLLYEASNSGWHAGFLTEYGIRSFKDRLKDWQPDTNHLFVFDFVVGREQKIKPILQALFYNQDEFKHKIRILLIERQRWDRGSVIKTQYQHTQDELGTLALSDKAEWFLNLCEEDDLEGGYLRRCRFDNGVEELEGLVPDDLTTIVKQLMTRLSGRTLTLSDDELKKTLARIDDSGRPLYAYLLAQQLGETQEGFQSWTRFDLLNDQLTRDKRRWKQAFEGKTSPTWGDSHPAMKLAVLATIVREVEFQNPQIEGYFDNIDSSLRKKAIAITSGYLINDDNRHEKVYALEPDLLGEWFVLYCFYRGLKFEELLDLAWQYSPDKTANFLQKITQDFIDLPKKNANENLVQKLLAHRAPHEAHYQALANVAIVIIEKLHKRGLEIPQNIIVALEHNANSLDLITMSYLGCMYIQGNGVARNPEKGVELLQQAIKEEFGFAMVLLGLYHAEGTLIEQDWNKAIGLYQQAVGKDNAIAMTALGICYEKGNGVKQDWDRAIDLYQEAVARGDRTAMVNLGVCYERGEGVEQNLSEAIKLYRQASELGHSTAMVNLGFCYEKGIEVEQNWDAAIQLYQRAVKLGNGIGMINLGLCYQKGEGVQKNWSAAINLFQGAVKAGEKRAVGNIQIILLLQNFLDTGNYPVYKTNSCSNKGQYPHSITAPIFDPPIMAGKWKELAPEEVSTYLDKIIAPLEILDLLENLDGYLGQYARCLPLSFYKDCNLIEIQFYNSLNDQAVILSAIFNTKKSALLLNRDRNLIQFLNPYLLLLDSQETTVDYLRFFCSYFQYSAKPFQIVSNIDEIPFNREVSKPVLDNIKKSLFSPAFIEGSFEIEGWQKFKACVLYGDIFLITFFTISSDGMVSAQGNDNYISFNLPIFQYWYSDVFRTPLHP